MPFFENPAILLRKKRFFKKAVHMLSPFLPKTTPRTHPMKKTILIGALGASLALSGCSITHGTAFNPNAIASIQRGVTTEGQIRAMFGEPVAVNTDTTLGQRRLTYRYDNDSSIQKGYAAVGGALVGGLLGSQIGGGSGSAIASGLGASAGGVLAENAVTARREEQTLVVYVDMRSGIVTDYRFTEDKSRTQSWGIGSGVAPL